MKPLPAKLVDLVRASSAIYIAKLKLLEPLPSKPKPFQFVMLWVPGVKEMPMSIADYVDDELTVVFRIRGEGTRKLAAMHRGSILAIRGPLGKGLVLENLDSVLTVAGGVGIAPLPYFLRYAGRAKKIVVAWGTRTGDEIGRTIELLGIAERAHRVELATEDGSIGFQGTVIDLAKRLMEGESFDTAIFVGPIPMLKAACSEFRKLDPYVVLETLVKCGEGMCGSCYIPHTPYLLCIDGPVFRCSQVEKYLASA